MAPQYKLKRICYQPVADVNPFTLTRTDEILGFPIGRWFGYNWPALTDAGPDYILAWGGVVYDNAENNDPFYWHVLKIRKSTFKVETEAFVALGGRYIATIPSGGPTNQDQLIADDDADYTGDGWYWTVAGVTVANGKIYCLAWEWFSEELGPGDPYIVVIGGPFGIYRMFVIDLDSLTASETPIGLPLDGGEVFKGGSAASQKSNTVRIDGFESVLDPSGGTERNCSMFVRGDYVIAGAHSGVSGQCYMFRYQISTNQLTAWGGIPPTDTFAPQTGADWTVGADGSVYRLSVQQSLFPAPTTIDVCRDITSPSFSNLSVLSDWNVGGGNPNANGSIYIDDANHVILSEAFYNPSAAGAFRDFFVQISTQDGSVVKAVENPFKGFFDSPSQAPNAESSATPEYPWSGFAPAVYQVVDDAGNAVFPNEYTFYLRDRNNVHTRQLGVGGITPAIAAKILAQSPGVAFGADITPGTRDVSQFAEWPDPGDPFEGPATPFWPDGGDFVLSDHFPDLFDGPWDILFTRPGKPMYICLLTSDLFVGVDPTYPEIAAFYEYTAGHFPWTQLIT